MKKINLLALVLIGFAVNLSAQTCTIDTTHLASVYVYPPADSLPHITQGVYYDQTVQGKIKSSFDTTITILTFVVTVDSVLVDSITGLPSGITYALNPPFPRVLKGGGFGCVEFYGTTSAAAGQYPMTAYGNAWGHASNTQLGIDTPVHYVGNLNNFSPFGGYYLVVDSATTGLHVSVNGTSPLCSGGTGSATATATGGTTYTYSWSNGATTQAITSLTGNTYTVTVTSGGQTATGSTTITVPSAISATLTQQHTTCNNAIVSAAVTGGTSPYTYSWSSGSTDSIGTVAQNTTVYLTVTDANACQFIDSSTFICAGIANDGEMVGMQLYPDPASTVVHVNVPQISSATVQIKIYDLTGQIVFSKVQNTTGALTTDIDVHSYAPGAYFVEVTDGTLTGRQKFVIER